MIKTFTFSLAATALLMAETNGYESVKAVANLDTIVVEAPKLKTKELTSTAAVEVYTADEIKASKAKDIGEFLNAYTSVSVQSGFGNNFSPKIELRGFGLDNGNQNVVVVVDGRRLNNVDSASQFLSAVPLESIGKIEILKGTGSVEYGDNATAGVISITTKPYEGVQLQTYAGNYGTSYGSLGAGFNGEKLSLSVFGDRFNQDGIRVINLAGDTDKQELTNGRIDAAYYVSDTLEFRLNAFDSDGSIFYAPAQTLTEYENDPRLLGTAGSGNHSYQKIDDRVLGSGVSWAFGEGFLNFDVYNEDKTVNYKSITSADVATFLFTTDYDNQMMDLTLEQAVGSWRILGGLQGFDGERHTVNNFGSDDTAGKRSLGAFAKASTRFGKQRITLGARYEEAKYTFNDATTSLNDTKEAYAYDIGYNYTLGTGSSLFANINRAFVMPDTDKFFTYDFGLGAYTFNGFIEPMTTVTYNVGYNRQQGNNSLKATLFYIDGKDEIYYNPTTWQNTNYDKTKKYGLELFNKYRVNKDLYVQANYTYVDATIESDAYKGNTLPAVSKHSAVAVIGYTPIEPMLVTLSHTYRSKAYGFEDLENDNTQKQDAYNATDLSLSYRYKNGEFYAKVNNLFDHANMMLIRDDAIHPVNASRTFIVGAKAAF